MPVDLRGRDWGAQIERACAATYMHPAPGTSVCIRCVTLLAPLLGTLSLSDALS